jgi:hypothetical protein
MIGTTWTYARHALALAVLALTATACAGSSAPRTPSAPSVRQSVAISVAPSYLAHGGDRDNDGDRNDDDIGVLGYGRPAGAADRSASVALATRYLAAAARGDGAAGCRLLVPAVVESIGEAHERSQRRLPCAAALSALFREHHAELALKSETLRVIAVRVEGARALAVLDFSTIPEVRELVERRVGDSWRLVTVLDGILE